MLLGYGFVTKANEADVLALKVGLPPSKLNTVNPIEKILTTLDAANLRHLVPRSGELPPLLLAQVRLLVSSKEEQSVILKTLVSAPADSKFQWDAVLDFLGWEVEFEMLDTLEDMLEMKLAALLKRRPIDDVRADVKSMIDEYRSGQSTSCTALHELLIV